MHLLKSNINVRIRLNSDVSTLAINSLIPASFSAFLLPFAKKKSLNKSSSFLPPVSCANKAKQYLAVLVTGSIGGVYSGTGNPTYFTSSSRSASLRHAKFAPPDCSCVPVNSCELISMILLNFSPATFGKASTSTSASTTSTSTTSASLPDVSRNIFLASFICFALAPPSVSDKSSHFCCVAAALASAFLIGKGLTCSRSIYSADSSDVLK